MAMWVVIAGPRVSVGMDLGVRLDILKVWGPHKRFGRPEFGGETEILMQFLIT